MIWHYEVTIRLTSFFRYCLFSKRVSLWTLGRCMTFKHSHVHRDTVWHSNTTRCIQTLYDIQTQPGAYKRCITFKHSQVHKDAVWHSNTARCVQRLYDIQTQPGAHRRCMTFKQPGAYRRIYIIIFKPCETWRLATCYWLRRPGNKLVTAILKV